MATLDNIYTLLMQTQKELKNLTKNVRKINASLDDPDGEKRAERAKNNGFNRPQKVSPELLSFLGLPEDALLSRSDVTRQVNVYITNNGLKHPDNGRVIMVDKDEALQALLQVPHDVQLTYLNIQRYLSVHYVKDPPAAKPADEPADETPAEPVDEPAAEPAGDPADLNGDGRVTRSEEAAHTLKKKSMPSAPTPIAKKPTVVKKKPTVRKPAATTSS
jgi:chromatin remodeling complex protein RSC6